MTLSLQRALIVLVLLVLVVGLLPAGLLLDRRLVASLEARSRAELDAARLVLRDRFQNQAGARMMHAREISASAPLVRALRSDDSIAAVAEARALADAFPGELPVVVGADGRSWVGPQLPSSLVAETRDGAMPVVVMSAGNELGTVALAPVGTDAAWSGAAGVWVPMAGEEAAQLSALTRSDVLLVAPDGALGAYTGLAEPAMGLFGLLADLPTSADVHELEWAGERYFVATAELPGAARVAFVRALSEELAVVPELNRVGALVLTGMLLFALAVGVLASTRLSRPVRALATAAERIRGGDLQTPVERSVVTEVDQVARAFDLMRDALAARIAELSEANAQLEDRQSRLAMLQAELVQRDRLSAAARLLAQLAHEVRNPVASVRNCLEVLRRRVADDEEAAELADLAIDELLRMHELAEQMLDLHRPRGQNGDCDAVAVAEEVATLVRLGHGEREVTIVVRGADEAAAAIPVDALKQILFNLVQNALEAIPGEGAIEVVVHAEPDAEHGTVRLEVTDTGPGIDPEVLPRVLDPFVTTKTDVHGVGLGLFTADGLARTHGGRLRVGNTERGGAQVVVELPAAVGEGAVTVDSGAGRTSA